MFAVEIHMNAAKIPSFPMRPAVFSAKKSLTSPGVSRFLTMFQWVFLVFARIWSMFQCGLPHVFPRLSPPFRPGSWPCQLSRRWHRHHGLSLCVPMVGAWASRHPLGVLNGYPRSEWYGYESIPINTIFRGMNIHLPAILGFTRYQGFDPSPYTLW